MLILFTYHAVHKECAHINRNTLVLRFELVCLFFNCYNAICCFWNTLGGFSVYDSCYIAVECMTSDNHLCNFVKWCHFLALQQQNSNAIQKSLLWEIIVTIVTLLYSSAEWITQVTFCTPGQDYDKVEHLYFGDFLESANLFRLGLIQHFIGECNHSRILNALQCSNLICL